MFLIAGSVRPIIACMWIENFNETPPMEFEKLLTQVTNKGVLNKINDLLTKKKAGFELGIEPKIVIINNFIENMIEHFEKTVNTFDPGKKPKQKLIGEGFVNILEKLDGK